MEWPNYTSGHTAQNKNNEPNRMTSTSFNVGLGEAPRLSGRVLRPPGGGHTDIFGGDPEPPRGRRQFPGLANAGQGDEPAKPTNGTSPTQNGQPEIPQEQAAPEPKLESPAKAEPEPASAPAPAPAPASTPTEPPKAEPTKVDPPKRVRVPPGGFSSGLW